MAKISKKTIEELEDILNRGCDYADTQTVVTEYANEALKESGCELCQCDDAMVVDWDEDTVCTVEEFANIFWDKAVGSRSGPERQGVWLLLFHLGHQFHPAGQLSGDPCKENCCCSILFNICKCAFSLTNRSA